MPPHSSVLSRQPVPSATVALRNIAVAALVVSHEGEKTNSSCICVSRIQITHIKSAPSAHFDVAERMQ